MDRRTVHARARRADAAWRRPRRPLRPAQDVCGGNDHVCCGQHRLRVCVVAAGDACLSRASRHGRHARCARKSCDSRLALQRRSTRPRDCGMVGVRRVDLDARSDGGRLAHRFAWMALGFLDQRSAGGRRHLRMHPAYRRIERRRSAAIGFHGRCNRYAGPRSTDVCIDRLRATSVVRITNRRDGHRRHRTARVRSSFTSAGRSRRWFRRNCSDRARSAH